MILWWTLQVRVTCSPRFRLHAESSIAPLGAFEQAVGNPDYDWNFVTVPQPGLNNATATQPRGKMLGGSSGLNYMIWTRGSAAEYNAWEEVRYPLLTLCYVGILSPPIARCSRLELEFSSTILQEKRSRRCTSPVPFRNLPWSMQRICSRVRRVPRALRTYPGIQHAPLLYRAILVYSVTAAGVVYANL